MFFNRLYILRGVFSGTRDFAKDLNDYMIEDGIPTYMIDINSKEDFHSAIGKLAHEKEIAVHLDIHGNSNCIQFHDTNCESWKDVAGYLELVRRNENLMVMTMNVCEGASLLDFQGSNNIPYLENLIASRQTINVSEGCSRCHLFYRDLYLHGNINYAWKQFNDTHIINKSDFHLYIKGVKH